jgi:hypothetical protein
VGISNRLTTQISDTQCGFKAFRRERAWIIFEQQRVERFGFDPQILFLAKRNGLRVAEVPVRWSHDAATKVNVAGDGRETKMDWIKHWVLLLALLAVCPLSAQDIENKLREPSRRRTIIKFKINFKMSHNFTDTSLAPLILLFRDSDTTLGPPFNFEFERTA